MKLYFIKDSTKTTLLPGNNALDAFSFEGRINLVRLMTFKKATFFAEFIQRPIDYCHCNSHLMETSEKQYLKCCTVNLSIINDMFLFLLTKTLEISLK